MPEIPLPEHFDIREANNAQEPEEKNVVQGGRVEPWQDLKSDEQVKMRAFIARTIILLCVIWVLLGLAKYLVTGDTFLLISSCPLLLPLQQITGYYFAHNKK